MTGARFARMPAALLVCVAALTGAGILGGGPLVTVPAGATSTWFVVSSPNVASNSENVLDHLSCSAGNACVAVGGYAKNSRGASYHALVELWNGKTWSIGSTPSVGTATSSYLDDISCITSATWCVTVGSAGTSTMIASWNGTTWTAMPSPTSTATLYAVSCRSMSWCMAVGGKGLRTFIERWNGTTWSIIPSPSNGTRANHLGDVSCVSVTSCAAVGYYNDGTRYASLAESWNGTAWSLVPSPNRGTGGNFLRGVSCGSATSCTAIGDYANSNQTLVESRNGATWSLIPSPNKGTKSNELDNVACQSTMSCTAVGSESNSLSTLQTLIESWNGTQWTVVSSPSETNAYLSDISCRTSTACKAVGGIQSGPDNGTTRTLVEASG